MTKTTVVTASIDPIQADQLMNLTAEPEPAPGPITLHLPQFEVPPGPNGELAPVRCNQYTIERADLVAENVIKAMSKMEINELSSDLLTLAYAYVSSRNTANGG